MSDFYDALETRDPGQREQDHFKRLPDALAWALSAPGWARYLDGVDPLQVSSREALARLPVLRKSDLVQLQQADPPFGGFNVTPPGKARRLLMSPGPVFEPEGSGNDRWGAARAMFATGFRPGDIIHNAFSYHLTPGGFILESGAHALGCAVVPAGTGNTEHQLEAIAQLRPDGYLGTPDFLVTLLDAAERSKRDASSIRRALVSGAALPNSLRDSLSARGVMVLQCYATAELGVIAYESPGSGGMILNENVVLEIVRPGSGDPVPDGDVGEVVVTSFNPDYPMIRLATGDLSAIVSGASPCGRTNTRLKGWLGRADQTTKVKGMFVHPAQVAGVAKRHPELGRVRLVVSREGSQDVMVLYAECEAPRDSLEEVVSANLQALTKLRGRVQLVAPGSLPNDGKIVADERPRD